MFVFRKIWRALFSWNTHFVIRPFVLLATKWTSANNLKEYKLHTHMTSWSSYERSLYIIISFIIIVTSILAKQWHEFISLFSGYCNSKINAYNTWIAVKMTYCVIVVKYITECSYCVQFRPCVPRLHAMPYT